jgi:hypothetical protein
LPGYAVIRISPVRSDIPTAVNFEVMRWLISIGNLSSKHFRSGDGWQRI